MANKTIGELTEIITLGSGDFLAVETSEGTRKIQRNNFMPGLGSFTVIDTDDVDILNTRIAVLDPSDGKPREISVRDLIFGNFQNRRETSNFTLTPGTHNIQAVELDEEGANSVTEVTLDGNTTGIAGCDFYLVNMRASNIAVTANNITMNVDGVAADGVIRLYRAATITVKNDGTRAIFSGG